MTASLSRLLYWDTRVTPTTLLNSDGTFMSCLRCVGPDLHSALDTELIVQADQLNNCFKRLGGGWGLQTEARRWEVARYPEVHWRHPVARLIDARRRAYFTAPGQHYETETTLTLTWKRPRTGSPRWKHFVYANLPADDELDGIRPFEEQVRRTAAMLQDAMASVTILADEALLSYLHSTISWKRYQVAVPDPDTYLDHYLAHYLADTDLDLVWALPSLFRVPKLGTQYLRCVSAKAYPRATQPGMLDVLDTLPMEYRACVRFLPLTRRQAVSQAQTAGDSHWGQRHRTGGGKGRTERAALTKADETSAFQEGVELDLWSAGKYTQTVVVWDSTLPGVHTKAETVEGVLNNAGFTAKIEGINTLAAWNGTLPGNRRANARTPLLTSKNLGHLGPATSLCRGPAWNAHLHGPPLLMTTGRGQTPFALDLHDDDVGHTMIIGPTGAGKSTLLALLCLQWLKYADGQAQVYLFDKDQSAKAMTYGVGGDWYDLGAEIERTAAHGTRLDDAATKPWGTLWEPPRGAFQCFETASLLSTPEIIPKVLAPLLRQLETNLTGVPTILALDEAWRYLNVEFFRGKIQDYLLTLRKANGVVIFSTQNLGHIINSAIGLDIYDSCVTKIFLPNTQATAPKTRELYEGIGLTSRQISIIAAMARKRQYYYMGPHGQCVFELGLDSVTLAFTGAGRKEDLAAMERLYLQDAAHFGEAWLRYRGQGDAAEELAHYREEMGA